MENALLLTILDHKVMYFNLELRTDYYLNITVLQKWLQYLGLVLLITISFFLFNTRINVTIRISNIKCREFISYYEFCMKVCQKLNSGNVVAVITRNTLCLVISKNRKTFSCEKKDFVQVSGLKKIHNIYIHVKINFTC